MNGIYDWNKACGKDFPAVFVGLIWQNGHQMIGSKEAGDDDDGVVTGKHLWKSKSSLNIQYNFLTIKTGKMELGTLIFNEFPIFGGI